MCLVEGLDQKAVIGATILNTIVVETVKVLKGKGMEKPPIFYSANLDGGDELNKKLIKEYQETIHYQF